MFAHRGTFPPRYSLCPAGAGLNRHRPDPKYRISVPAYLLPDLMSQNNFFRTDMSFVTTRDSIALSRDQRIPLRVVQIARNHFRNQVGEAYLGGPAEFLASLGGIAEQRFHLSGAEIPRIHSDQRTASHRINANLIDALASPLYFHVEQSTSGFHEMAYRELLPCRNHEVLGNVAL